MSDNYNPLNARATVLTMRRRLGPDTFVYEPLRVRLVRFDSDPRQYLEPVSDATFFADGDLQTQTPVEGIQLVDSPTINDVARFD